MEHAFLYSKVNGVFFCRDKPDDIHIIEDRNEGLNCDTSVYCFCEPEYLYVDPETRCRVFGHKSFEQLNN